MGGERRWFPHDGRLKGEEGCLWSTCVCVCVGVCVCVWVCVWVEISVAAREVE